MNRPADSQALGHAAALLNAAGADRERVPAETALDCLYAADLLELAGARPQTLERDDADPRERIRDALQHLASLDQDPAVHSVVSEATQVARDALARLG